MKLEDWEIYDLENELNGLELELVDIDSEREAYLYNIGRVEQRAKDRIQVIKHLLK